MQLVRPMPEANRRTVAISTWRHADSVGRIVKNLVAPSMSPGQERRVKNQRNCFFSTDPDRIRSSGHLNWLHHALPRKQSDSVVRFYYTALPKIEDCLIDVE